MTGADKRQRLLVHLSPHQAIVAALTMEAVVDITDRVEKPVYEPLVFARVCDIGAEYGYGEDITSGDFLKILQLLEVAKHVHRSRRVEPRTGMLKPAPHVEPTEAGRQDAYRSRPLLREILCSHADRSQGSKAD